LLRKLKENLFTVSILLVWVVNKRTVILFIADTVIVSIGIASVTHTITISVVLVAIGNTWAVVIRILDTIPIETKYLNLNLNK